MYTNNFSSENCVVEDNPVGKNLTFQLRSEVRVYELTSIITFCEYWYDETCVKRFVPMSFVLTTWQLAAFECYNCCTIKLHMDRFPFTTVSKVGSENGCYNITVVQACIKFYPTFGTSLFRTFVNCKRL